MSEKPKALSADEAMLMLSSEYDAFLASHGLTLETADPFEVRDLITKEGNLRMRLFFMHCYTSGAVEMNQPLSPRDLHFIVPHLDAAEAEQPDLIAVVTEIREDIRELMGGISN